MLNDVVPMVVVTGASSGIGLAIARHLLDASYCVTGVDVAPACIEHAHYRHVQDDLSGNGDETLKSLEKLRVYGLVHAAGVLRVGPLGQLDLRAGELMWRIQIGRAHV